jgi:benzylsuccinate CoA-transferase BbsF subunit
MTTDVLRGIRVLDFSWVMAGPMSTKMLGAMGAEVIKVESSLRPEYANRAGFFATINTNKKSCSVNFTVPEGQLLVRELVAKSDVLVENFSAKVLPKYGLGYEDLRAIRPELIYVSASGLGRTGPERDMLAYGTLLQGYSGRAGMIGEANGRLEAMGVMPAWTDPVTGYWETFAILAALRHRQRTGAGAYVDLSMIESTVALLPEAIVRTELGQPVAERGGNREPGAAPAGCFRAAGIDAWVALSVRGDDQWQAWCEVTGQARLRDDARFRDPASRVEHKADLDRAAAEWLRERDAEGAADVLRQAGVPAEKSRHFGEIVEDLHLLERGLFPAIGETRNYALPWRDTTSGWRGSTRAAPALGEHNAYVFGELLGMSAAEIERLVAEKIIA